MDRNGDQRFGPQTIHRHLALLSAIFRNAVESERLDVPVIPWPKGKRVARIRWYALDEERSIIAWFDDNGMPEMARFTEMAIDSGFRRGQLLGAYRVVGNNAVLDDQKGGTQTQTPLTVRARAAAVAKPWAGLTDFVVNKRWEKMRDALGLGSMANIHACRHTTAMRLALAKVPLKTIQKFMRHSRETVTLIYIHLVDQADTEALAVREQRDKSVPNKGQ